MGAGRRGRASCSGAALGRQGGGGQAGGWLLGPSTLPPQQPDPHLGAEWNLEVKVAGDLV